MRIAILASPDAPASAITGPLEILSVAGELSAQSRQLAASGGQMSGGDASIDGTEIFLVAETSGVLDCGQGVQLLVPNGLAPYLQVDMVVVSAIGVPSSRKWASQAVLDWLRAQSRGGAQLTSFCTGAFLLAASGLLNGRMVTTHWAMAEKLQQMFPEVHVNAERMLTCDGNFVCAGGASAYQDLMLFLIRQHFGRAIALQCAKWLLLPMDREFQTEYSYYQHKKWHQDELVHIAQHWIESHFAEAMSVADLAARACLSERHFKRRFKEATGQAPLHYLQQVRVAKARQLLEETQDAIAHVSHRVGYGDEAFFRQLFKRSVGLTPAQYRQKFGGG